MVVGLGVAVGVTVARTCVGGARIGGVIVTKTIGVGVAGLGHRAGPPTNKAKATRMTMRAAMASSSTGQLRVDSRAVNCPHHEWEAGLAAESEGICWAGKGS